MAFYVYQLFIGQFESQCFLCPTMANLPGTIFLIDDDRSVNFYNRWIIQGLLKTEDVHEFESSEAAISQLNTSK